MKKLPIVKLGLRMDAINTAGECPLAIKVMYKGRTYPKGIGVSIKPELFRDGHIAGNDRKAVVLNSKIRLEIIEIETAIMKAFQLGELDTETIKGILKGKLKDDMRLMELWKLIEEKYSGLLKNARMIKLRSIVSMFTEWDSKIKITQIDNVVLLAYESYMKSVKGNKGNTIWSNMAGIKSIIEKGLRNNIISYDPFRGYKMPPYKNPKRSYITLDQIEAIKELSKNPLIPGEMKKVSLWFILACESGMRYSDLGQFDESRMIIGDRLYFSDIKEETPHFVPLHDELKKAINNVHGIGKIPTGQECNRYLKLIAIQCGIAINLTMHVARHSFAVNYIIRKGKMQTLQKLMGHKKAETTAIYGQITDATIEDEARDVFAR